MEEVQRTYGPKGPQGAEETYQRSQQQVYLEATLWETLRLHPPVPFDYRQAQKDDTLPDGTPIPKGAHVSFNPYCFGRAKAVWGPDVDHFKPERFLNAEGEFQAPSQVNVLVLLLLRL